MITIGMPQSACLCQNIFARHYEDFFRRQLFWDAFTLKDVETVEKDPARVKKWVALARDVIEDVF